MYIHEYEAKNLLKKFDIAVPQGWLITSKDDLKKIWTENNLQKAVLKAQIHAGGRGKAGGVKLVSTYQEAIAVFDELFNKKLVTSQTTEEGILVSKLYMEETANIKKQLYLAVVLNRKKSVVSVVASADGGMDIEQNTADDKSSLISFNIDSELGVKEYDLRETFKQLSLDKMLYSQFAKLVKKLYHIYLKYDATLIEINPLIIDDDNNLVVLDAKMNFDDNALYRQPEILQFKDDKEQDENEVKASSYGLSYVALDGEIGCLVNGAGLAMATMDSIKFAGGNPANFLDIGGKASADIIADAMTIIISLSTVKGVLVNVFGGINHCDVIAKGIVMSLTNASKNIPVVVRLQGVNYQEGKRIIEESGLPIYLTDSMDEGSDLIVKLCSKEADDVDLGR